MQLKKTKIFPKTWVEISKSALLKNINLFKKIVGTRVKVAAVVKANAYGHGLKEVVSIIKDKTDLFAVDSIEEALSVREMDKKVPVLVLGFVRKENIPLLIKNNISFVFYRLDILKYISKLKSTHKAKIHLKIETGLNRQGVNVKEILKLLDFIKINNSKFILEGAYMHFANVEDTLNPHFAKFQMQRFNEALKTINRLGFYPPLIHSAATAAAMLHKESHFTMIRAGIGLYGLWPSEGVRKILGRGKGKVDLKPVLSWRSIVVQLKNVQKGESVGYGRTWYADKPSAIAVVPLGYSDGLDRKLSNIGKVIIRGKFAPVVGRVAMNMIMVDVTGIKGVLSDDIVTIIGKNRGLMVTAEDLAEKLGTINYEVVARISPYLPRVVVN